MIEILVTTADAYMIYWHTPINAVLSPLLPRWAFLVPEYLFLATTSFAAVNAGLLMRHGQTAWGHFGGHEHPVIASFQVAVVFVGLPVMAIFLWQSGRWNDQDAGAAILAHWCLLMATIVFIVNAVAG